MLMLLIQIIGAIGTAVIAIILLKKDWRTKNEAIRKEAVLVTKIIFAVTIVSILNLAVSSFQSQYDISKLEKDKRQLQVTNANLSFDISKNAIALSRPALPDQKEVQKPQLTVNKEPQQPGPSAIKEPQKKLAAKEPLQKKLTKKYTLAINKVAKRPLVPVSNIKIKPEVDEARGIPFFHFVNTGNRSLAGVLIYRDNRPVYDLSVSITNYDNLMDCKSSNDNAFDSKCFISNTFSSPTIVALNAQSNYFLKLPQFKRRADKGRYVILLKFNNKTYTEEAIYSFSGRGRLSQALRIKEYDDGVLVNTLVLKDGGYESRAVNWKRGFPLPLNEQSRKILIASN